MPKLLVCPKHRAYKAIRPPTADCPACEKLYIQKAATKKGKAKGGGQSSKAKGRRAVQEIQQLILNHFPELTQNDVVVKATSQTGVDLHLSEKALSSLPHAIEAKNVESLNIWAALAQAEINAVKSSVKAKRVLTPVVYFKRSRSRMYVALRAEDFLALCAESVCDERFE